MASALRQEIEELENWYGREFPMALPMIQSLKAAVKKAEEEGTELPETKDIERLRQLREENQRAKNVTSLDSYKRKKPRR